MTSSKKEVTKDLERVLQLNDALFINFTPVKMLQGDNIRQLSTFITDMLCKPQMYKKKLMVNTLNCLLSSWEEDVAVYDLLEGCFTFLSVANDDIGVLPALRCDDNDNFCLFATALLNLCKDAKLKTEICCNVVKSVLHFKESEDKLRLIRNLWSEKDSLVLPIETVEELVLCQPVLVEEPLVNVALTVIKDMGDDYDGTLETVLAEPAIVSLVDISARSPVVFQMVTSVIHSLVCRAPLNLNLLRLSREVVAAVSKLCGPCGIVPLLPPQQHALALCLQLDPELLSDDLFDTQQLYLFTSGCAFRTITRSSVLRTIAAELVADPAASSALLVYYPHWLKLLFKQVTLT